MGSVRDGRVCFWSADVRAKLNSFGYDVKIASHVISPSRELGLKIYIKKVIIEDGGFVGATSRLAPGVHVKKGALVKATTNVYPDTVVEKRS